MPPKKPAVLLRDVPKAKDGKTPLTAKRYHVRALSDGVYTNEHLYAKDDEFLMVIYDDIDPPKYVEILNDGEVVDMQKEPRPADPMAADVKKVPGGFAGKIASATPGGVI